MSTDSDFVFQCWQCKRVWDEAELVVKKNPVNIDNYYCPDCDVAVMDVHKMTLFIRELKADGKIEPRAGEK